MKTETRRPKHETNYLGTVIANVRTNYALGVRDSTAYAAAYVAKGETELDNPYIVFSISPDNTMIYGVPLDHLLSTASNGFLQERDREGIRRGGLFIGHWTSRGVTREVRLPMNQIQQLLVFWDQWAMKR